MRYAAISFACLLTTAAFAAGPEDSYFAARDAAIAHVAKLEADKVSSEVENAAIDKDNAVLEDQLRKLIGPVTLKGYPGPGKLNLETLSKFDEGFGALDGLAFVSADGKATLVATTVAILGHWLVEHRNWWEKGLANPPQTPEAALRSVVFYTQAMSTDAAFNVYAELAITKPTKADLAVALLDARSQDETPEAPDEIVAAVVAGGRVLIAAVPMQAKLSGVAACTKINKLAEPKIQAAEDANVAADRKNDSLAAKELKLRLDAEAAFRACYQDKAKGQKGFAAAQAQAQGLVDAMTAD